MGGYSFLVDKLAKVPYNTNIQTQRGRDMYIAMLDTKEQEAVVRALKGWQFHRKNHGSLFDRGSADSYYGRMPQPHFGGVGGESGPRVEVADATSVAEYLAGYEDNEQFGSKKEW
jgi:hypothetical protein